jgi:hypothetical protein
MNCLGLLADVEAYCLNNHAFCQFSDNGGVQPTSFPDKLLSKVLASARANEDAVDDALRSAMLMSIVSSARRHDLDVWVYLNDVLEQILAGRTDYHGLLPDVWKLEHPEAVRQYRVEEREEKADRQRARAAARRLAS